MDTVVVDQSPSEPRLHRALYVIKYLRAMILNLVLVFLAIGLYVVAGIDNVYPLANESIRAISAQSAATGPQRALSEAVNTSHAASSTAARAS